MSLYFDGDGFDNNEPNQNAPRKGKKIVKVKKKWGGEDFERGFGNNKKKNKPRRGSKDRDNY